MTRWNWEGTFKKISTWLGILAASSGAGLVAYATLPARAQELFPDWTLLVLGVTTVVPSALVGAATAYKQKGVP